MDHVQDQNPKALHRAIQEDLLPDFVKTASIPGDEELAPLHDSLFADPVRREYPVHTKASAWMGLAYFYGTPGGRPSVEEGLKQAAAFHGIEEAEVETLKMRLTPVVKEASNRLVKGDFALPNVDFAGTGGIKVASLYPCNDLQDVIDSSRQVTDDFLKGNLPLEYAKHASIRLMRAAEQFNVREDAIPAQVRSMGVERLPDLEKAAALVEQRCALVDDESAELYREILKEAEASDEDDMEDFARMMITLDAANGMTSYSASLPDPYSVIFSGPQEKDAAEIANNSVYVNSISVPIDAFRKVDTRRIQGQFTPKIASQILDGRAAVLEKGADAWDTFGELSPANGNRLLRILLDVTE